MDKPTLIETILQQNPWHLPACSIWPKKAQHEFDRRQLIAVLAAREIDRPLLVRGEPGCGKTQLARAAAEALKMPLVTLVVNERTETEDLFWHYDALRRLSDANDPNKGVQDEKAYLSAGPLWWALNHKSAKKYRGAHRSEPYMGKGASYDNGVLLLIDEIDKADRSVPNSLLEALGNYSFEVPYTPDRVECTGAKPLIIITTNDEQELPPAFQRRCLTLDLSLPSGSSEKDKARFVELLARRGRALFAEKFDDQSLFEEIAEQVWEKREALRKSGDNRRPGQAEYLDHLEAILAMKAFEPDKSESEASEALAALTYGKY